VNALLSTYYATTYPIGVGANKGESPIASAGWFYDDTVHLLDSSSNRTSVQCQKWCDKRPNCKAWGFVVDPDGNPSCELYKQKIIHPTGNESWKVDLVSTKKLPDFGGVAANVNRFDANGKSANICKGADLNEIFAKYEQCLLKLVNESKAVTSASCKSEVARIPEYLTTCMQLPKGDNRYSKGSKITPTGCSPQEVS
jgi:hypothetical protein